MVYILSGKYARKENTDIIVAPDMSPKPEIDKSKWTSEDSRKQYYEALNSPHYSHRSKRFLQKLKNNPKAK